MNNVPVNVAVIDKNTITKADVLRSEKTGVPVKIKAIPGGKYLLAEGKDGVAPENITLKRVGKNLLVCLEGTDLDQPQLIIEGFFDHPGELVGLAEDGNYHEYIAADGDSDHEAAFLMDGESSGVVLGSDSLTGMGGFTVASGAWSPALLALGALAALGAIAGIGHAIAQHNKGDKDNGGDNGNGGGSGGGEGGSPDPEPTPGGPAHIGQVTDNVGSIQGPIENGGFTDDTTPTLEGTGTPGNVVIIIDNGKPIGSTTVDEDGNWEFTPETGLSEGNHNIVVVEKDKDGNESEPSDGFDLIVDLKAPGKGEINDIYDDVGTITGKIPENGTTDDSRPTFTGTAEANAKVEIWANDKLIGTTTANDKGEWSFTPETDLPDGTYNFTTIVEDAAGNRGLPSDPQLIIIDTTPPDNAGIGNVIDNEGDNTGLVGNGGSTDDKTPTLIGTGNEGDKVTIIEDGKVIGTAIVDDKGNWEFPITEELEDGDYNFEVVVTDPWGNSSEESDEFHLTIDTTPPTKPAITGVYDDQGNSTGKLNPSDTTDDASPLLKGTAEANSLVYIYDGSNPNPIGSAQVNAQGEWQYQVETPLTNGSHSLTVVAVDAAKNESVPSDAFDFDVLTGSGGITPSIGGIFDDAGDDTGLLVPGDTTDDKRPTLEGSALPGTIIHIKDGDNELGSTTTNPDGSWSYTPPTDLPDGEHNFTVIGEDANGEMSPETGVYPITIDTLAPPAADGMVLIDDVGSVTGRIETGMTTDDNKPTLSGNAEPNTTVIIYDNGIEIGRVPVKDDGTWSFESPTRPDGEHSFTTIVMDKGGNKSPESEAIDFSIDTSGLAVGISYAEDDVGTVRANLNNGDATDDTTPTLHGTSKPGAIVYIYVDGSDTPVGSVQANQYTGAWQYELPAQSEGTHVITARADDGVNGLSDATPPFTLVIDLTAPNDAVIVRVADDVGTVQDDILSGMSTDDTTPTLHGTGTAGDTITVYDTVNGVQTRLGTATVDPDGTWTFQPNPPLNPATHNITITATDPVGHTGAESAPWIINVDVTPPVNPGIGNAVDDEGADTGLIKNGGSTDDSTPTLIGTGVEGDKITVIQDGNVIGTTYVDAEGKWEYPIENELPDDDYKFEIIVTDPSGNSSGKSEEFELTIDTEAPDAPVIVDVIDDQGDRTGRVEEGTTSDDASPLIRGTGEIGSLILIYDGNSRTPVGSARVDGDGNWECQILNPLPNGSHSLTAVAIDAAQNASTPSDAYDFDTLTGGVPSAPAINSIVDDVNDPAGTVLLNPNDFTNDSRPTLSGTAEDGTFITIMNGQDVIGTATVTNGQWSFTPDTDLPDGDYNFTAIAENILTGNKSTETGIYPITIDATPPPVATGLVLTDDYGDVTGVITPGMTTDDNTPILTGMAEAGDRYVLIYDNGELWGTATVNPDGSWRFESPVLPDGAHDFTTVVVDRAGNKSEESAGKDFTVDTSGVAVGISYAEDNIGTVTENLNNGDATDDTNPVLQGTSKPDAIVYIYVDGSPVPVGSTQADSTTGAWSYELPTLGEGSHSITATADDGVSGESEHTPPFVIVVDLTAPTDARLVSISDDVGVIQTDLANPGVTDDTTPTLHGTGTEGDTITIYDTVNGVHTLLGTTKVLPGGIWTYQPDPPLNPAVHNITFTAKDPVGNVSEESDPWVFTVDTYAPDAASAVELFDDAGLTTGLITTGTRTDDQRPTYSGIAEEGEGNVVIIRNNGQEIARVPVGAGGVWTYTPDADMDYGDYVFSTIVQDAAGNQSAPSDDISFSIVDGPASVALIGSMSKDSGSNRDDFLTNDGSAGRMIQGTLSAALANGERVQISTDGGLTWIDAVVSGDKWVAVDGNAHDGDFEIQARVTDTDGRSSPLDTQQVTLDTNAPDAPTSITSDVSDNSVTIGISSSNVLAGDVLVVENDSKRIEHLLTDADIIAGEITITSPEFNLDKEIISFVVDDLGNSSQVLHTGGEYTSSIPKQALPVNTEIKFDGYTFIAENGLQYSASWAAWGPRGNHTEKFIMDPGVTEFTLPVCHYPVNTTGPDLGYGEFIATFSDGTKQTINFKGVYAVPIVRYLNFVAPEGETIIEVIPGPWRDYSGQSNTDLAAYTYPSVDITVKTSVDPYYTDQDIDQNVIEGAYYGFEDNNIFSIAEVSKFTSDVTQIDGGEGTDTLKLTGSNQTFDFTGLSGKVSSIEVIDLTGSGDNKLNISLGDVMNQGEKNIFVDDNNTQMMVKGNAGDSVTLSDLLPDGSDAGDWVKETGTVSVEGANYEVYRHSTLEGELLVQQGVTVNLDNH